MADALRPKKERKDYHFRQARLTKENERVQGL